MAYVGIGHEVLVRNNVRGLQADGRVDVMLMRLVKSIDGLGFWNSTLFDW